MAAPATARLRVALISAHYPPMRTSAAVQMRDLAQEVLRQGHEPVVIVPTAGHNTPWAVETLEGVTVLRLAAPQTHDLGYLRRTLGEFMLPFLAMRHLAASPMGRQRWDLVAWYSPTIFFGPLVWWMKRRSGAHLYLILRDIFPEWAVDLGLLREGLAYRLLKAVANLQYRVADTIGVQTPSNLAYLKQWHEPPRRRVEVLQNWQTPAPKTDSTIVVAHTPLAGRKIFAYVGNMGVAQGIDIFIALAEYMQPRRDIGFLFVGRGSEYSRLTVEGQRRGLDNLLFHPEIDSFEIPGLLAQCHVGIISLDPRHRTHNIPGKFLTYLIAGLPVLARLNSGTDLETLIEGNNIGICYSGVEVSELALCAEALVDNSEGYASAAGRAHALFDKFFTSRAACRQILGARLKSSDETTSNFI